jgi:hypothetical protein
LGFGCQARRESWGVYAELLPLLLLLYIHQARHKSLGIYFQLLLLLLLLVLLLLLLLLLLQDDLARREHWSSYLELVAAGAAAVAAAAATATAAATADGPVDSWARSRCGILSTAIWAAHCCCWLTTTAASANCASTACGCRSWC